jgi:hypothetical protein
MTRRTRTALVGSLLVGALILMGAGFPAQTVPASQWATGVCTTVNTWVTTTQTGADDLNVKLSGKTVSLRDIREALTGYLGDTAHATTLALDGLASAGTPKTPKGKQAAAGLTASFKKIRASLRKLRNQAESMSIQRKAKALKQVKTLNRQVTAEFDSFNAALRKLRKLDPNHQLKQAFAADPACQQLSS